MDITYSAPQPAQPRQDLRAQVGCALTADRSLFVRALVAMPRRAENWTAAAHTEGRLAFGMSIVRSTTPSTHCARFAGVVGAKGDRQGSPAWSPPV